MFRGWTLLAAIIVLAAWAATVPPQPIQHAPALQFAPRVEAQQKSENGSEYWPTFLGMHVKITDSLLALFTLFLVLVGTKQGSLISKQIELSRAEFLSTHRPTIDVRWLEFAQREVGKEIILTLSCVNIGGTSAHIEEIRLCVFNRAALLFTEIGSPARLKSRGLANCNAAGFMT